MAQNEIQKFDNLTDLYDDVRVALEKFHDCMGDMGKLKNFLSTCDEIVYPGIPTETLADLVELRTKLNAFLAATATIELKSEVDEFVRIRF